MKKIVYPLIIVFISGLLVLNYYAYKSPKTNKVITQNKVYTILNEQNLLVPIYFNYKTPYVKEEAFESIYLIDAKEDNKLMLNINNINEVSKYSYLEESFKMYEYLFSLPTLTTDISLNEAYLLMNLKNGDSLKLLIGSFNYYYQEKHDLNLINYHATKKADLLEIETITMQFKLTEPIYLKEIKIGSNSYSYEHEVIDEEEIKITVSTNMKVIDALSIKIIYLINDNLYEEVLPYFVFFEYFDNPLTYSVLNNVYQVN